MTNEQAQYLRDLRGLDNIGLGMLAPSNRVKRPEHVRDLCAGRGWVRILPEQTPSGLPIVELRTSGLRALRRHEQSLRVDT